MIDLGKIIEESESNVGDLIAITATTPSQFDKVFRYLRKQGLEAYALDGWDKSGINTRVVIDEDGDFTTFPKRLIGDVEQLTLSQFKARYEIAEGVDVNIKKNGSISNTPVPAPIVIEYDGFKVEEPEISDQHAIKELDFNGCKIWLAIDYKKQELSFVEFKVNTQKWEPKKWDFSGRGPEYLNGWIKILDAMKSAVEYGKEELRKGE